MSVTIVFPERWSHVLLALGGVVGLPACVILHREVVVDYSE